MPTSAARPVARATGWAGGVALVLALAYLLAPPMGTDLSAQVARADFFAGHGLTPVDFGWYGGTVQFGYSLVSPAVMALIGVRMTGAVALVVSAVAFAAILARTAAPRPVWGGIAGAVCIAGNLVSGRVTYALGVAFALLGLLALTAGRRWVRLAGGIAGAFLAGATSPVAGLFTGLAAVAVLMALAPLARGRRPGRRVFPRFTASLRSWLRSVQTRPAAGRVDGRPPDHDHEGFEVPGHSQSIMIMESVAVGVAAAVPIGVTSLLFGEGGWMNISPSDTVHAVVASLAVAVLVARPAVRIGAVLAALGVLAAFAFHTPVGLNATRLAVMFTLPVVVAYATVPARVSLGRWAPGVPAVVVAALAWWQPPVMIGDLRDAGNPSAYPSYFAPLRAELARRQPVGRIEVPPTRDYWEAAYATPLARGWLRQVDLSRNELFFAGTLTPAGYQAWLVDNGVRYVALADVEVSWVGAREATLIRAGQPYLRQVWRGRHWTLYQVTGVPPGPGAPPVDGDGTPDAGDPSLAGPGAALLRESAGALTVDVDRPGRTLIRIRWSRWLTVSGPSGARLSAAGRWTTLAAPSPGRYTISSKVVSAG